MLQPPFEVELQEPWPRTLERRTEDALDEDEIADSDAKHSRRMAQQHAACRPYHCRSQSQRDRSPGHPTEVTPHLGGGARGRAEVADDQPHAGGEQAQQGNHDRDQTKTDRRQLARIDPQPPRLEGQPLAIEPLLNSAATNPAPTTKPMNASREGPADA